MMMKLSPSTTLALFLAAAHQTFVSAQSGCGGDYCELQDGQFQSCSNPSNYIQGFDLGGGTGFYTCTSYPGAPLTPPTAATVASSNSAATVATDPGLNGWECYPEGAGQCPPGYAISEMCVSNVESSNPLCSEYCQTPGYFAIKCVPSPIADVPLDLGEWLPANNGFENALCDSGSVMCGLCISSNPSDCQGMNGRAKCCSPSPNVVEGSWQYMYEVTAHMHENSALQWGTQKTAQETETNQWSESVTASVSAGFSIAGVTGKATVSGSLAQEYGQQYSNTWSTSELQTFDITFTTDQEGETFWVWQWQFAITDSFGNNLSAVTQQYALTKSRLEPPQCQPGYNSDENYQVCDAGFYLPGYVGPTTRRNLRAGSSKN